MAGPAVIFAIFTPRMLSASDDEDVILILSPAFVSVASASSSCVKSICKPSNEAEPAAEVKMLSLSVGVEVPIPTQSSETVR